jgi:hypothetical protein
MRQTLFAVVLLLALEPISLGAANGAFPRPPVIFIHMQSSNAVDEQVLQSLLVDSISLELTDRGMEVLAATSHARAREEILDLAESAQADFALVGAYTLKEESVLLEIEWLHVRGRSLVARASRLGPLDLSFDSIVAEAVGELLSGQEKNLANLPPRTVRPEEHASAPIARTESREIGLEMPLPLPELEPREQPSPDVSPPTTQGPATHEPVTQVPEAREKPDRPLKRIAICLGAAPFIATFNATKYFAMGLSLQLAGQFRVPTPGGFLGFGLAAAAHEFLGKGAYVQADFLLIPIGLDLHYGTRTGSFIDFFAHASGGPAIFAVRVGGGNPLAKVVPYVMGGVGVTVSMWDGFGICIDGSYTAFFDSPSPIMAYIPSVSLLVRM